MIELIIAGAGGLLAWALWPKKTQVQVIKSKTANGTPVTVVYPVAGGAVSPNQAKPASYIPPLASPSPVHPATPLPNNQGIGTGYSPAAVVVSQSPGVLNLGPTVITPTGAASLNVTTVQDIQNALNTLGYANPPLLIDSKYGPATTSAIRDFQASKGLPVDGIVGPNTKAQLASALASLASTNSHIGQSPIVLAATTQSATATVAIVSNKDVQHALNVLGATPPLAEDGALGPKSIAALKAFQLSHGLMADGIAGPKTKTALYVAIGSNVAGESSYVKKRGPFGGEFGSISQQATMGYDNAVSRKGGPQGAMKA